MGCLAADVEKYIFREQHKPHGQEPGLPAVSASGQRGGHTCAVTCRDVATGVDHNAKCNESQLPSGTLGSTLTLDSGDS